MSTVFLIKDINEEKETIFFSYFGSEHEFIFDTKEAALEMIKNERLDDDNYKVVEIEEDLATLFLYGHEMISSENETISSEDRLESFFRQLKTFSEIGTIIKEMLKAFEDDNWPSRHYLHYVQKFVGHPLKREFIIDGIVDRFEGAPSIPDEPEEGDDREFETYSQYLQRMIVTIENCLPQELKTSPQAPSL